MGWILVQPNNSDASTVALALLCLDGICTFDLTMNGARLRPLRFGSCSCAEQERHSHSFVGEAACCCWAVSQNRKFLWGSKFFWLCDCSAIKEILDHDGPIHQICRWAQELLGCFFQVFHRPACMIKDVDGLKRFNHPLVAQHHQVALQLCLANRTTRPAAYEPAVFHSHNPLKCVSQVSPLVAAPPPPCPSTVMTMVSHPAPLVAPPIAASYLLHALLTNLPVRFRPLPGIPSVTDPSIGRKTFQQFSARNI
jgi:hypothetical protein